MALTRTHYETTRETKFRTNGSSLGSPRDDRRATARARVLRTTARAAIARATPNPLVRLPRALSVEETPRGRQRRSEIARRTRTAAGRPRRNDRDDDGCARRRDTRGRREGDENSVRASKARRCAVFGDGDVRDGWGIVRREDRGGERRAARGRTRTRTRVRTRARERRRVRRVKSRAGVDRVGRRGREGLVD